MTIRHAGPGPCAHCQAGPGEPCAAKRKHRKGWRAPCVVERQNEIDASEEAAFALLWAEAMRGRELEVQMARLEANRRRRNRAAYAWLAVIATAAALWLAYCARQGWIHLNF